MKLTDINILVGEVIKSIDRQDDHALLISLENGRNFRINLYDEGGQNDSHASIGKIDMSEVVGHTISEAYEESKDSCQAILIFKTRGKREGRIELDHDHNGYYNFSYDVEEL